MAPFVDTISGYNAIILESIKFVILLFVLVLALRFVGQHFDDAAEDQRHRPIRLRAVRQQDRRHAGDREE